MTTMVSFDNDWTVFFTRPISGGDPRCSPRSGARLAPVVKAHGLKRLRASRSDHAQPG